MALSKVLPEGEKQREAGFPVGGLDDACVF